MSGSRYPEWQDPENRPEEDIVGTIAADLALWMRDSIDDWLKEHSLEKEYGIDYHAGDGWAYQVLRRCISGAVKDEAEGMETALLDLLNEALDEREQELRDFYEEDDDD